jgi:hypothetical protein
VFGQNSVRVGAQGIETGNSFLSEKSECLKKCVMNTLDKAVQNDRHFTLTPLLGPSRDPSPGPLSWTPLVISFATSLHDPSRQKDKR